MGEAFMPRGGGGSALNFKVLAYATEEALLAATPVENTTGIITETPITSWIFSATEPSPAEAGKVWITTGTSSPVEFNALKKNGLQVYPISAKQYVGGAWVDKIAKSYQGGEWVDWWDGSIYNSGNEYADITGGWALSENYNNTHGDSLSKDATSMTFSSHFYGGQHYASGFLRANNKISLKNIANIILQTESVQLDSGGAMWLCAKTSDNAYKSDFAAMLSLSDGTNQTFTLPVNHLNESYYIGIEIDNDAGGSVVINNIKIQ